jgi:hypothetical protein
MTNHELESITKILSEVRTTRPIYRGDECFYNLAYLIEAVHDHATRHGAKPGPISSETMSLMIGICRPPSYKHTRDCIKFGRAFEDQLLGPTPCKL